MEGYGINMVDTNTQRYEQSIHLGVYWTSKPASDIH
jgi:hypothetical protein